MRLRTARQANTEVIRMNKTRKERRADAVKWLNALTRERSDYGASDILAYTLYGGHPEDYRESTDEEDSPNDDCGAASCDKCGFVMRADDEGWFGEWHDDIEVWWDEDGTEHHGYVLKPDFKFCPNCGREVVGK